jgi:hypothetical protein
MSTHDLRFQNRNEKNRGKKEILGHKNPLKGTFQPKLRWVKSGDNRWLSMLAVQ